MEETDNSIQPETSEVIAEHVIEEEKHKNERREKAKDTMKL